MVFDEVPVARMTVVDGKELAVEMFKLDGQIALDVGLHEVEFSCQSRGGYDERDFSETLRLDLQTHHEYLVRCSFDSGFSVKEKRIKKK